MTLSPEMILSKSVCEVLETFHIEYFHVPNEGRRTRWESMQFKINGGRPGVSDLVLILPQRIVFIELKTEKGTQSTAQKEFQRIVELNGHRYEIWRSIDDALQFAQSERQI
jgi:hypothetical protein